MKSLKLILAHFTESYLNEDDAVAPIQKRIVAIWKDKVDGVPLKEFNLKEKNEKLPEETIASYVFDTIADQIKNGNHWNVSYHKEASIENILVGRNNFRDFEDNPSTDQFNFYLFKEKLCNLLS